LPAELPVSCHIAKWRQELYKAWRWSNGAAACGSGAARTGRQARSGRRVSAAPTVAVPSLQVERSAPLPMPRVFLRARGTRCAGSSCTAVWAARALLRSIFQTQPAQSCCWHSAHNAARLNAQRRNLRAAHASCRKQIVYATKAWRRARPRSRAASEAEGRWTTRSPASAHFITRLAPLPNDLTRYNADDGDGGWCRSIRTCPAEKWRARARINTRTLQISGLSCLAQAEGARTHPLAKDLWHHLAIATCQ